MPIAPDLLETKLIIPPANPDRIRRPRLDMILDGLLKRRLGLVIAPAGSGKTTLVSSWLSEKLNNDVQGAWISLEASDQDPVQFLNYLLAAFLPSQPEAIHEALTVRSAQRRPNPGLILRPLLNALAHRKAHFILVLDDFHNANTPANEKLIGYLVERAPACLRIILASRTTPELPLARIRTHGQVLELSGQDLRFNDSEIRQFMKRRTRSLADEALDELADKSEGWAAGLQLAALSIQNDPDPQEWIKRYSGGSGHTADYLFEEVFDRLPNADQRFLLETSILDRFNAELATAVSADPQAAERLTGLQRDQLFIIPLDSEAHWFRYHHLFQDFLQARHKKLPDIRRWQTHSRAAQWLAANGRPDRAVRHAATARDYDVASQVVLQFADDYMVYGDTSTLASWFELLPDPVIRNHPDLCIWYAWILHLTGRSAEIESYLQRAAGIMQDFGKNSGWEQQNFDDTLGSIAAVRSNQAMQRADLQTAVEHAHEARSLLSFKFRSIAGMMSQNMSEASLTRGETIDALELAQNAVEDSSTTGNHFIHVSAQMRVAYLRVLRGELYQAESAYRQIFDYAQIHRAEILTGAAHLYYGNNVLREQNRFDEAERIIREGLRIREANGLAEGGVQGQLVLGHLRQARGLTTEANAIFANALRLAEKNGHAAELSNAQTWLARQSALSGDTGALKRWILSSGLSSEDDLSFRTEKRHMIYAKALILVGRPDHGLQVLSRIQNLATAAGRRWRVIESSVIQARGYLALHDRPAALAALHRALIIAQPHGFVRLFIDEGAEIYSLLNSIDRDSPVAPYAAQLCAVYEAAKSQPTGPLSSDGDLDTLNAESINVESLSPREKDVLALLAAGMSNQKIADELTLSLNTIRWHNRNIYRKLGANNRTQAAAIARQLNITSH
jgi:LuxR family maltose regulon positive regulatory protein